MAWLSGLAGKAESLLNKIDQNTAAVLSKEKQELEAQPILTEVTWVPPTSTSQHTVFPMLTDLESNDSLTPIRPIHNLESASSRAEREEELITYLNTPTDSPVKLPYSESSTAPATPLSIYVEPPTDTADSISEISLKSGQISPVFSHTSVDVPENDLVESFPRQNGQPDLQTENFVLKNKIEALNNALKMHLSEANSSGNESNDLRHQSTYIRQDPRHKLNSDKLETELLAMSANNADIRNHSKSTHTDFGESKKLSQKQQTDYEKEINVLKEQLTRVQSENSQVTRSMSDLRSTMERNRMELAATRSELEHHRSRALRTLQEKEKLIAELRSNATTGLDDATLMELNQLRLEREALRDENQHMCVQLELARNELVSADAKLEQIRQEAARAGIHAQEAITIERNRRIDVEEDSRHATEELRNFKEEASRQRNSMSLKLQKQQTEISRLRSQLSAASTPTSEVESRLANLTQTLVQKQQALEHLTTERNALRLQLEKIEHQHKDIMGNLKKNMSYDNVNDTDDAKAQVPAFLLETPFDTGVARRVKRAYSSLDAVSVRTGIFLRRYPLARILTLVYMVSLHFWVLVVLFSHSPEAQ